MQINRDSARGLILRLGRTWVDVGIAAASFYLAYVLTTNSRGIAWAPGLADKTLGFALISGFFLILFSVDRGSWRHVSIPDLLLVIKTAAISMATFMLASFLISRGTNVPRSVPVLAFLLMVAGMAGIRLAYRLAVEGSWLDALGVRFDSGGKKVLLYGFTDQAEGYIRMVRRNPKSDISIVGIVDDKLMNRTRTVQGVSVVGTLADIDDVLARQKRYGKGVEEIIVAERAPTRQQLSEIVEQATARGLKVSRLPDLTETASISSTLLFEPKPIELGDLLGRPEVKADTASVARLVRNRVVLVTGAGGSIGSELCRQIALVGPSRLIITDSSEFHLYLLDNELRGKHPELNIVTRILNVREPARVRSLFSTLKPEVVFHAAALKHVPLVEDNPIEGVKTNVLGTRNVADAAIAAGSSTFVVISTDKAVNPTNIMGATKRAAEAYCQALDITSKTTRFKTVRFGNVLGSNGSVVPLFQSQIAEGGPVTVTHPHIVRFFMTIPEAVRLVLHASAHRLRNASERGKIMVLDMGKPVRIVDLAERMIQLAGYRPRVDIDIVFTGLRPGEKLYEELFDPSEMLDGKTEEGYVIASPRIIDAALLQRTLEGLDAATQREDLSRTVELLSHIVPEYRPGEAGSDAQLDLSEAKAATGGNDEDWR